MKNQAIILKKVCVHNLKEVDLTLKSNEFIVFTGVSGSGKSSLAFDTLYIEGQRRYIESLPAHARHLLSEMTKPDVEYVSGLSPTISIEQKSAGKNPRSLVATMTEIYDYLRVVFARIGAPHCPVSGEAVSSQSKEQLIHTVTHLPEKTKILILAPFVQNKKGELKEEFALLMRKGYMRARLDGKMVDLSEEISLDKKESHTLDVLIDRTTIAKENFSRIAEAITSALSIGSGNLICVNQTSDEEIFLSTKAFSKKSNLSYPPLEPSDFSFNSPSGMCESCHGLGITEDFDLDKIIDSSKSIAEDCCLIASSYQTVRYGNIYRNLASLYHFNVHTPWKKLSENAKKVFLFGTEKKWISMHFVHPTRPIEWTQYVAFKGVLHEAKERYSQAKSQEYRRKMQALMTVQPCQSCLGSRLKAYPSATLLKGKKIHEIIALTVDEAYLFFSEISLDASEKLIAQELVQEIVRRLLFLKDVGLGYLTLDRSAPTLSGGESQRVRLASQVGSGLVGVTYILDEPSIGLHPIDNHALIKTLQELKSRGNTVIVVEHDEDTILAADRVVDFGPGPGVQGGQILYNGDVQGLLKKKESLTAAYLSGREEIPATKKRKRSSHSLILRGAEHNNLKKIDVEFPLGLFIAVTGVSGSGKSSLISDILYPALANALHRAKLTLGKFDQIVGVTLLDKVIAIDQSPIGRSARSNPATYIKIFDEIRALFAQLPASRSKGFTAGRFSFNVKEGSCSECRGLGQIRVDMDFMEDLFLPCPSCQNQRFDSETLSIYYKGKNIYDVLNLTVDEALDFFSNIPTLREKLEMVSKVGMGYITLGQASTTLSGGEAQRVKLAKELIRPSSEKTLYLLDEPTTGLHFHDVKALLRVLHELVDRGSTVCVIEHNMEVVKTADWIIELGPKGGKEGGYLIAQGPMESVLKKSTPTSEALRHVLKKKTPTFREKKEKNKKLITEITVKGASQNNLKNVDLAIPRGKISVFTGPSGSGKSSLAFDTIYAEGQRRYIESLSPYARGFVKQMAKPKLTSIEGLSPAIAIEQKAQAGNPRSTLGTISEIYDYLRLLYSHKGTARDPETKEEIRSITKEYVIEKILKMPLGEKITILAPLDLLKADNFDDLILRLRSLGYLRVRLNQEIFDLDQKIPFDKKRKNSLELIIDRFTLTSTSLPRVQEAVASALKITKNRLIVSPDGAADEFFNLSFALESSGKSFAPLTPHSFSFNSPSGMCVECQGLGFQYGANFLKHKELLALSARELFEIFFKDEIPEPLLSLFQAKKIDLDLPLKELFFSPLTFLLKGSSEFFEEKNYRFQWLGLEPLLAKAAKSAQAAIKWPLLSFLDEVECAACGGARLNPLARNVILSGLTIAELCRLPLEKVKTFISEIELLESEKHVLSEVIKQIDERVSFLMDVGLGYLSLDRRAPTLSNGESERIHLARGLASRLTGVLYVLDEPTVGLHPFDNEKLNSALLELKNLGNTLLLVEHDPMTVKKADYLFDFGPEAGLKGGKLMAQGTLKEIMHHPHSITGAYLSGKKQISIPEKRREAKGYFPIKNANIHNLKNIDLEIPLSTFCCLTGVSGSGKSTLMHEVIYPLAIHAIEKREPFDKVIVINQNPMGHTSRADVGTYMEIVSTLRSFYASLAEAKMRGLEPKHFSYNHRRGMCTHCFGLGYKRVDLVFLPSVKVVCDACNGLRLNPLSLTVRYMGKNFGELFAMTVEEMKTAFEFIPKAKRLLETLISVGLGYLTIGQELSTLSSGEGQRLKLARELAKRQTGKTLYLMDEPTTGLHFEDIEKLIPLLHRLVDAKNTMVIIEHNVDFLKNADFIFDLGPDAGDKGGYLVASGTPEEIAKHPSSRTAPFLRDALRNR